MEMTETNDITINDEINIIVRSRCRTIINWIVEPEFCLERPGSEITG